MGISTHVALGGLAAAALIAGASLAAPPAPAPTTPSSPAPAPAPAPAAPRTPLPGRDGRDGPRFFVERRVVNEKGYLGVVPLRISAELRAVLGAPGDRGALIDGVRAGSPADKGAIAVGDVVTEVDGKPVTSREDILAALAGHKAHDVVAVATVRNKEKIVRMVTLEDDVQVSVEGNPEDFQGLFSQMPWDDGDGGGADFDRLRAWFERHAQPGPRDGARPDKTAPGTEL